MGYMKFPPLLDVASVVDPLMPVNLFNHAPCWINNIVTDNFTQKCVLYQPASNLRHALINGVFSVFFKKRCQSVLCVISESFLFVCLFSFIPFRKMF